MLSQDIPHIFALTLFEDYVYWTDWETKSINRAHKTTGTNKTLLISTLHRPMDLHVFHALRQPDGEQARGGSRRRVSWEPGSLGVPAYPFSSTDQALSWPDTGRLQEGLDRGWFGSRELQPSLDPVLECGSSKALRPIKWGSGCRAPRRTLGGKHRGGGKLAFRPGLILGP